ncbi:hypothetical protein CCP3SC15_1310004 [Gammaproteobacteria bacterium]
MANKQNQPPAPTQASTLGEGSKIMDEIVSTARQIWANKDKPEQLRHYIIVLHGHIAALDEEQKVV